MLQLTRYADWRARLSACVEARRRAPFSWSDRNCGLFVADCILAMTGADPAAAFRGSFTTAIGARRALGRAGYPSLHDFAATLLPAAHPSAARVGDVMWFAGATGTHQESVGVVVGERVMVYRDDGLGSLPLTAGARAFLVG